MTRKIKFKIEFHHDENRDIKFPLKNTHHSTVLYKPRTDCADGTQFPKDARTKANILANPWHETHEYIFHAFWAQSRTLHPFFRLATPRTVTRSPWRGVSASSLATERNEQLSLRGTLSIQPSLLGFSTDLMDDGVSSDGSNLCFEMRGIADERWFRVYR